MPDKKPTDNPTTTPSPAPVQIDARWKVAGDWQAPVDGPAKAEPLHLGITPSFTTSSTYALTQHFTTEPFRFDCWSKERTREGREEMYAIAGSNSLGEAGSHVVNAIKNGVFGQLTKLVRLPHDHGDPHEEHNRLLRGDGFTAPSPSASCPRR